MIPQNNKKNQDYNEKWVFFLAFFITKVYNIIKRREKITKRKDDKR
nr:MAG TPA: hypothetical protein [Caudoviricetes sp.]